LGWVEEMMGWVGLGYENWTHGHVCARSVADRGKPCQFSLRDFIF